MATQHMKRSLTKEMWIKTTVKYVYISIRITKIERLIIPSFYEQVGELELSCSADGDM